MTYVMARKLIVANWKMNPGTSRKAFGLFEAVVQMKRPKSVAVVVCPPFPYVSHIGEHMRNKWKGKISLGAQDVFWKNEGPYTGEVSPAVLRKAGATYAIVGHSERREFAGETDEMIAKKVRAALDAGLRPILCVGEPLSVRKRGFSSARHFVAAQLKKNLTLLTTNYSLPTTRLVIAYEPVWAISTSKNQKDETPEDASTMISYIKKLLTTNYSLPTTLVLYGGSVSSQNARSFLTRPEIDGALVGGASLKLVEFQRIVRAAT